MASEFLEDEYEDDDSFSQSRTPEKKQTIYGSSPNKNVRWRDEPRGGADNQGQEELEEEIKSLQAAVQKHKAISEQQQAELAQALKVC